MRIGYARVSTGQQNLDLQVDALEEAGCERIYKEKTSAVAKNRPELEKAMEVLREGDSLVVWRLDRFGRSVKDLIDRVTELEEKGVEFVSLTEGIDTSTAQGRLTYHIFSALAEFQLTLSRERTMAGLRAARDRGHVGGAPRAIRREDMPTLQAMMRDPDTKTSEICDKFDVCKATLYRYVSPDGERRMYKEEEEEEVS